MLRITLACIAISAALPAAAQTGDLQQLLSGKDVPHALKLKDLNADWRHVSISSADQKGGMGDMMKQLMQLGMMSEAGKGKGPGDAAGAMAAMSLMGGLFGGGQESAPVYYTQGRTTTVGGETFLVVYRLDIKAPSFMDMVAQSQKEGGKEPDFAKIAAESKPTGETSVVLALLNMKSIGALSDIRPFDLNREIEEAGKAGGGGLMDLFGAAAKEGDQPAVEGEATPAGAERDAEFALKDAQLTISSDALLGAKGNRVEASIADGKVVLKGTVTSARLKTRAENLTRQSMKPYGVSLPISNQITVQAPR